MTAIDPKVKFVRLERIDHLLGKSRRGYREFKSALERKDRELLTRFVHLFLFYRGERPFFAVYKSDIECELGKRDWLQLFIDGVGLFHHYPFDPKEPAIFALMEYSAGEVVKQARTKGIEDCFAVPTVLESGCNPAFCPTPRSTGHGYAVDLRERDRKEIGVREILHPRLEYSWEHVKQLEIWTGAATPDVEMAGERRL